MLFFGLTACSLDFNDDNDGQIVPDDYLDGIGSYEIFSDPAVFLSMDCSIDTSSDDLILVYMTCEAYKELMVDNTPPNKCDEITIINENGVSFTGFFEGDTPHEKCN